MARKGRKTAKTGDKALKKLAAMQTTVATNKDDHDDIYDKQDQWHNRREEEFIRLDNNLSDDSDTDQEEAVMNIETSRNYSDNESVDDDDETERDYSDEEENPVYSSAGEDEEQDDDEDQVANLRDWGKRKSSYYHGDTADLEIGQDKDDALVEEEAAKSLQKARYEEMSEDDFVLSDAEEDTAKDKEETKIKATKDMTKLSRKEREKILERRHPEMLPLVSYFGDVFVEYMKESDVAVDALFKNDKGKVEVSA
jgi:U3 small nucleolar RNA-associated protein 3